MSGLLTENVRTRPHLEPQYEIGGFNEYFDVELLPTMNDTMKDVLRNGTRADKLWVSTVFMLGGKGSKKFIKEFCATCGVLSALLLTVAISGIQSEPKQTLGLHVGDILVSTRVYYTIEVLTVTFSLLGAAIPTLSIMYVGMLRNNSRDVVYFLSKFNYIIFVGNLLPLLLSLLGVISSMLVRLFFIGSNFLIVIGGFFSLVVSLVWGMSIYHRLDDSMHHMYHIIRVTADSDFRDNVVVPRKLWPASSFRNLPGVV